MYSWTRLAGEGLLQSAQRCQRRVVMEVVGRLLAMIALLRGTLLCGGLTEWKW